MALTAAISNVSKTSIGANQYLVNGTITVTGDGVATYPTGGVQTAPTTAAEVIQALDLSIRIDSSQSLHLTNAAGTLSYIAELNTANGKVLLYDSKTGSMGEIANTEVPADEAYTGPLMVIGA